MTAPAHAWIRGSGFPPEEPGLGTVAVVYGGRSSEREISLVSGRAVISALTTAADLADRRGPRRVIAVELSSDGSWVIEGHPSPVGEALERLALVDVFFLALHGGDGEGGAIQGLLQSADRCFVGSGVASSAVCLDKAFARDVVAARGLSVARGEVVTPSDMESAVPGWLDVLQSWGATSWCVKPRCGGSSVGVAMVERSEELGAAIRAVLVGGDDALVEERIDGVEVTCAVLGNRGDELRVLTPVEIQPRRAGFFDYGEKYSEGGAREMCPPVSLSAPETARVRELAAVAHSILLCDGFSRSDFIVPRKKGVVAGEPVFLEMNTLPGLTPRSLVPLAAAHDGLDFRSLCLGLIRDAERSRRGCRVR